MTAPKTLDPSTLSPHPNKEEIHMEAGATAHRPLRVTLL